MLPAIPTPYPASPGLKARVEPLQYDGIDGDEFPTTWAGDDSQYSGAGDNQQPNRQNLPLSAFRITGGPPDGTGHDGLPVFHEVGPPLPIAGPAVSAT